MECEYCKAKLSTKSALRYHQRSAKYCLKIQETQGNLNNVNQYNCDICGRNFTVKRNLVRHRESCVINTDSISTMAERLKTTLDSLNEYKRNEDMLKMDANWLQLEPEQRHELRLPHGLVETARPLIEVDSTDSVLKTLDVAGIAPLKDRIAAMPGRYARMLVEAAVLLEPKTQAVSLPSRTLKTETEVDSWLAEARKILVEKLGDGPVMPR